MTDRRPDPALVAHLEEARSLGFLGPGPVLPHIDHAEAFVLALVDVRGMVVDLGTGGGVPGLIIASVRPDLELVLVDARAVRCRFLERSVETLGLGARVVEGRAEEVARGPLRGTADAVVARSFGPPAATAECGSPLLRVGGRLVVSEPPPPSPADRWPVAALDELGLRVHSVVRGAAGSVQVLEQHRACPDSAPRRTGLPTKRPLF